MLALTNTLTSSSQDSSQKSQRILHPSSRIVNKLLMFPLPQIVEQIVSESKTQIHCAWWRRATCAERKKSLRTRLLVTNPPRQNSKRGGRNKGGCRRNKRVLFTIENIVNDVSLSHRGCESHEDGLVMSDSGASINVCPKRFGFSALEKSDGLVRVQDYGKRHVWLRIGNHLKTK